MSDEITDKRAEEIAKEQLATLPKPPSPNAIKVLHLLKQGQSIDQIKEEPGLTEGELHDAVVELKK